MFVFSAHNASAAANFSITPYGALPSSVALGQTVHAYYTITNQTQQARNGYTVVGLPNTVTQNSSTGYCATPINLAANPASCILQLDITGPVQSSFSLCHGASCTTAAVPLSVTSSSGNPGIAVGYYQNLSNIEVPLLAYSPPQAENWGFSIESGLNLPEDYNATTYAYFNSASCSGGTCIAGGQYQSTVTGNPALPLLAYSADNGANWAYPPSITARFLTGNQYPEFHSFSAVNCSDSLCIAVGEDTESFSEGSTFAPC